MRKLKVNNLIAWIAVLLLLAGFQANAQRERGYGPVHRHGDRTGRFSDDGPGAMNRAEDYLDLSEEQLKQIEELHLNFQKESLPARNKIREKWAQLHTLITESGDQSKIDQLIDEIGDLQVTIDKQRIKTHLKIRALLTEEQKIKFDTRLGKGLVEGGNPFRHRMWHGLD